MADSDSSSSSSSLPLSSSPPASWSLFAKGLKGEQVPGVVESYSALHNDDNDADQNEAPERKRKDNYQQLVTSYYDLVTDFYEYGWGDCFHFCAAFKSESFREAILRHDHNIALQMGIKRYQHVLDVGCGVGGPMRNIARFSGCRVTGVNLSPYQCKRVNHINTRQGGLVAKNCRVLNADFMNIPVDPETFDHAYQIEATAHAPSKVGVYREVFRCLKPGAMFAGYEWVMTDKFNPNDEQHLRIKKGIEEGDGLPDIELASRIPDALREAGFEVLEVRDMAPESEVPWYDPLTPKYTHPSNFQFTPFGNWLTDMAIMGLEKVGLAHQGTRQTRVILLKASSNLVLGGETGIFTPMLFHLARKPL